jgi:hypothetical protein
MNINSWSCLGKLTVEGTTEFTSGIVGNITQTGSNVNLGKDTLVNTTGIDNLAVGDYALTDLTTGNYNVSLGYNSSTALLTGNNNIAIGSGSMATNILGNNNIMLASNTTGNNNISIGGVINASNIINFGNNTVNNNYSVVISKNNLTPPNNGVFIDNISEVSTNHLLFYDSASHEISCHTITVLSAGTFVLTDATDQLILGDVGNELTLNAPTATPSVYTIPAVDTIGDFLMDVGNQTITGDKTFTDLAISKAANQLYIGSALITSTQAGNNTFNIPFSGEFVNTNYNQIIYGNKIFSNILFTDDKITINTSVITSSQPNPRTYTIPNVPSSYFVVSNDTNPISGIKTFTSEITTSQLSLNNLTLLAPGNVRTYDIIGTADADFVMNTGDQNISGTTTFTNGLLTGSINIGSGLINSAIQTGSDKIFTIPNVPNGEFIVTSGNQTITGSKTFITGLFTANLNIGGIITSSQNANYDVYLPNIDGDFIMTAGDQTITAAKTFINGVVSSSNSITIGGATITANSGTITIPVNTNANFMMSSGDQTITGLKTFENGIKVTDTNCIYGEGAGINLTGSNNVAIGYGALATVTTGSNNVAIGKNSGPTIATLSNTVTIGDAATSVSESIVINATATTLTGNNSGFFVRPIRNVAYSNLLTYNTTTNEVGYVTSGLASLQKGSINFVSLGAVAKTYTITYSPAFTSAPTLVYSINTDIANASKFGSNYISSNSTTGANIYVNYTGSINLPTTFSSSTNYADMLTFSNGGVGVGFIASGSGQLNFRYSSNYQFTSDMSANIQNAPAVTNAQISMTVLTNDYPAAVYRDGTGLRYKYSTSPAGASWLGPTNAISSIVSLNSIKLLSNGRPGIAANYTNTATGQIAFLYSTTAIGAANADWNTVPVNSTTGRTVTSISLVIHTNGTPGIAWISFATLANITLSYAYSTQADGSSGWTTVTVANLSTLAKVSATIINGFPAIAITITNNVNYYRSSAVNGASGWTGISLSSLSTAGSDGISLITLNNYPALCQSVGGATLRYWYSSSVTGANVSDWASINNGSAYNVYSITMVQLSNGAPGVVYPLNSTTVQYGYGVSAPITWTAT